MLDTLKYLQTELKKCPKCDVYIQKAYGCNHMRCTNCACYFDYVTMKISNSNSNSIRDNELLRNTSVGASVLHVSIFHARHRDANIKSFVQQLAQIQKDHFGAKKQLQYTHQFENVRLEMMQGKISDAKAKTKLFLAYQKYKQFKMNRQIVAQYFREINDPARYIATQHTVSDQDISKL